MITVIQRAKYFYLGGEKEEITEDPVYGELTVKRTCNDVIQPAIIKLHGLRMHSETPKTAAHAAKINESIDKLPAQ